jgi:hypothetical protein
MSQTRSPARPLSRATRAYRVVVLDLLHRGLRRQRVLDDPVLVHLRELHHRVPSILWLPREAQRLRLVEVYLRPDCDDLATDLADLVGGGLRCKEPPGVNTRRAAAATAAAAAVGGDSGGARAQQDVRGSRIAPARTICQRGLRGGLHGPLRGGLCGGGGGLALRRHLRLRAKRVTCEGHVCRDVRDSLCGCGVNKQSKS